MKSEFILAFNEIAETRKLPREVVMEALKAALLSAYKRNVGAGPNQIIEVHLDEQSGTPSIWVEKAVVEAIEDEILEITLLDARAVDPDISLGDMIMIDSTPDDFGRIAAQTAKQVILQRMREAEREAQYQEYQDRLDDILTGTVQSANNDVITISLGRAEAILPKSQQMPGERYRMHDKVRAYVMEVRKTNRGPQIVVSRTHRNMLRRLLEYEVPEIYNGTVEIMSIAREPGQRSKVAVWSNQPGADPVGACVGMRGVRIQSIVKELNGEKIDVIEWSEDNAVFISKALSPARVSVVFLDDDPDEGKTATVVVPDDQLSLAIGRSGQNARLGAKLTGWRIDIKSVSEAAQEAYRHVQEEEDLSGLVEQHADLVNQVSGIILKKEEGRPVMPEEYAVLNQFVQKFEGTRLEMREKSRSGRREQLAEARAYVPEQAYEYPLAETDLPLSVYNLLTAARYETVGQVMEQYHLDSGELMAIEGFGPKSLEVVATMIQETAEVIEQAQVEAEAELEADAEIVEGEEAVEAVAEVTGEAEAETAVETDAVAEVIEEVWEDEEDEEARLRRAELVARMTGKPVEEVADSQTVKLAPDIEIDEDEFDDFVPEDDEDVEYFDEADMTQEEIEEMRRKQAKQRRRQLVFDEDLGRVVAKRRRKESRSQQSWEDFDTEALDEEF